MNQTLAEKLDTPANAATTEPTAKEIMAFVGSGGDYYLRQWAHELEGQKGGLGFNWAAFWCPGYWLLYRKMYLLAMVTTIVWGTVVLVLQPKGVEGLVLRCVIAFICGSCGNAWYLFHARKVIARVRSLGLDEVDYLERLSMRGGASHTAALAIVGCCFAVGVVCVSFARLTTHPVIGFSPRGIAQENARRDPVEAVRQQLAGRINRYLGGETSALPFLSKSRATNISVVRVRRSANTNLPSVLAELLVDGKRHYLEIPTAIFPMQFIPTIPPVPTEAEIRTDVPQEAKSRRMPPVFRRNSTDLGGSALRIFSSFYRAV